MAIYVIGDVHGCLEELQQMLEKISYNPETDQLWFTGDLINGGPQSLATLRFVSSLNNYICVLGNHDLTLLALGRNALTFEQKHQGFKEILEAEDCEQLLLWLESLSLVHYDSELKTLLVHAGIAPQWSLSETLSFASEVENVLHSQQKNDLYYYMYGNDPNKWNTNLTGWQKLRFIINVFTRIRFCSSDGTLDFTQKGTVDDGKQKNLTPWFEQLDTSFDETNVIFGHWSALNGETRPNNIVALDTGCVWGRALTAIRLSDYKRFQINRKTN